MSKQNNSGIIFAAVTGVVTVIGVVAAVATHPNPQHIGRVNTVSTTWSACEIGSSQVVPNVCDDGRGMFYVTLNWDDSFGKQSLFLADRLRSWQTAFPTKQIQTISFISEPRTTDSALDNPRVGAFVRYKSE